MRFKEIVFDLGGQDFKGKLDAGSHPDACLADVVPLRVLEVISEHLTAKIKERKAKVLRKKVAKEYF